MDAAGRITMTNPFHDDGELPDNFEAAPKEKHKGRRPLLLRTIALPIWFCLIGMIALVLFSSIFIRSTDVRIPQMVVTATRGAYGASQTYQSWVSPLYKATLDGMDKINPDEPDPEEEFIAATPDCTTVENTETGKFVFRIWLQQSMELFRVDDNSANLCRLTNNQFLDDQPTWSPDGSQIAFVSNADGYGIYVMDSNGENRIKLMSEGTAFSHPAWSPDGQQIAFQATINGLFDIYVMNRDGSNLRNLTNNLALDTMPAWSPDGRFIAFASDRTFNPDISNRLPQYNSFDIYVMNADNGLNVRRLTDNDVSDINPVWSPDGQQIAFSANYAMYIMNANDSNLEQASIGKKLAWLDDEWVALEQSNIIPSFPHLPITNKPPITDIQFGSGVEEMDYTPGSASVKSE
jgi:WD40 repeat protein